MNVILASSSPRRLELIQRLGWEAKVFPAPFAEVKTAAEVEQQLAGAFAKPEAEVKQPPEEASAQPAALVETKTTAKDTAAPEREVSESSSSCRFTGQELFLLNHYKGVDAVPAYNALGKAKAAACVTGDREPVIGADTVVIAENRILGKPRHKAEAKEMLRLLSGNTHQVKTAAVILYQGQVRLRVVTTSVTFRVLTEDEIALYVADGEPMDKAGAYGIQGKGSVLVRHIEGNYDNVVGLPLTDVYEMLQELMDRALLS